MLDITLATNRTPKAFAANKYHSVKCETVRDLGQLFALPPVLCYVIAELAIDDFTKAVNSGQAKIGVGKENKEKCGTIRELTSAKGVPMTPALKLLRAIQFANDASANGINRGTTEWELSPELSLWVKDVAANVENGQYDGKWSEISK